MNTLLEKLTYQSVIDHLFSANNYWYAALPGIYAELAEGILEAKKGNPELNVELIIDPKESAFRSHFGDADAVEELLYEGITIKEIPNHRLGFIISDKSAWFMFTQSRAIEKEPEGYNAIRMSSVTKNEIALHFFGHTASNDLQEEYTEEMRELVKVKEQVAGEGKTEFTPHPLDELEFGDVQYSLVTNPPPSPDFKRLYDVYSTKIKFVEFEVSGIKFHQKTISIPNAVLNLVDKNLRNQIRTRLTLFDKESQKQLQKKLSTIEDKVEEIRKDYLKRVKSRNKSIIKADRLKGFDSKISELKKSYESIQEEIELDIRYNLIHVKERLKEELVQSFTASPPENLKKFVGSDKFELLIDNHVSQIVNSIKLPTAESLMKKFDITILKFDPTTKDFRDEAFINELEEIGFIKEAEREEIVEEFKAIGTQPDDKVRYPG